MRMQRSLAEESTPTVSRVVQLLLSGPPTSSGTTKEVISTDNSSEIASSGNVEASH